MEEELDQNDQSEGAQGLSGELDLYAAIGLFGSVRFEVVFSPQRWMYQLCAYVVILSNDEIKLPKNCEYPIE